MEGKNKNMLNVVGYLYSDNYLTQINWISIKY